MADQKRSDFVNEIRENYYDCSRSLSNVVRQLAFAGIGIVWIFNETRITQETAIAPEWKLVLVLVASTLFFDALQYLSGTVAWGILHRHIEVHGITDYESAPAWINWPALAFFSIKVLVLLGGYMVLIMNLL